MFQVVSVLQVSPPQPSMSLLPSACYATRPSHSPTIFQKQCNSYHLSLAAFLRHVYCAVRVLQYAKFQETWQRGRAIANYSTALHSSHLMHILYRVVNAETSIEIKTAVENFQLKQLLSETSQLAIFSLLFSTNLLPVFSIQPISNCCGVLLFFVTRD